MTQQIKQKILMVDDEPKNLLALETLLEDIGAELHTASSGNEALKLCARHEYCLVLLDVQMPVMDGFETAEYLRSVGRTRFIPIIFVTAINKSKQHIFKGYEVGAVDYLFKPLDTHNLISKVKIFMQLDLQKQQMDVLKTELERKVQAQQHEIRERIAAQQELQSYKESLESKVEERTRELQLSQKEALLFAERAKQASKAKSEFLATMSHEIRTPLNGIIGMTSFLLESKLDRDQTTFAESINSSADALLNVINDVLDFSKIEAGSIELEKVPCNLHFLLNHLAELLAFGSEKKGLHFSCFLDSNVNPFVLGDQVRLSQILINLANNAIKFTANGEVTVHVSLDGTANIAGNQKLKFMVRDTGIGISLQGQSKLFKAFSQVDSSTTRRYGGTGLGLAISKKLAEMMGGSITIDSEEGRGSVFSVHLSMPIEAEKVVAGCVEYDVDMRSKTVLLCEPDLTYQRNLSKQLEQWGCNVTVMGNVNDSSMLSHRFDLVVIEQSFLQMLPYEFKNRLSSDKTPIMVMYQAQRLNELESICQGFTVIDRIARPIKQIELRDSCADFLGVGRIRPVVRVAQQLDSVASMSVLLAEDDIVNQKVFIRMLKKLNHKLTVVDNGQLALDMLRSGEQFDLILMDCQMPVMDGFQTTQAIRKDLALAHTPIIALTANATKEDRQRCLDAGMDDYLSKPTKVSMLNDMLNTWHDRQHPVDMPSDHHGQLG